VAIWFILLPFGILHSYLVYFLVIWYTFPVFVGCSKKNLAALSQKNCPIGSEFCQTDGPPKYANIQHSVRANRQSILQNKFWVLIGFFPPDS
jgi:hypothetical protein